MWRKILLIKIHSAVKSCLMNKANWPTTYHSSSGTPTQSRGGSIICSKRCHHLHQILNNAVHACIVTKSWVNNLFKTLPPFAQDNDQVHALQNNTNHLFISADSNANYTIGAVHCIKSTKLQKEQCSVFWLGHCMKEPLKLLFTLVHCIAMCSSSTAYLGGLHLQCILIGALL